MFRTFSSKNKKKCESEVKQAESVEVAIESEVKKAESRNSNRIKNNIFIT